MKVFKLEIAFYDPNEEIDDLEEIIGFFEEHSRDLLHTTVKAEVAKEEPEWHDDIPLNFRDKRAVEYVKGLTFEEIE